MDQAECRSVSFDLFVTKGGPEGPDVRRAKEVCRRCEVRQECLDSTPIDDDATIRGGLTPRERRSMRRARRRVRV